MNDKIFTMTFGPIEGLTYIDDDFCPDADELAEQISKASKKIKEEDDRWVRDSWVLAQTKILGV